MKVQFNIQYSMQYRTVPHRTASYYTFLVVEDDGGTRRDGNAPGAQAAAELVGPRLWVGDGTSDERDFGLT